MHYIEQYCSSCIASKGGLQVFSQVLSNHGKPAMYASLVAGLAVSLALSAAAVPAHERRQQVASGALGTLAGILGANQTFDYVIVGAGNVSFH